MRAAVVTDIHGNLYAFEAVLRDIDRVAPDTVVFGGDAALFGAHPRECWERVRDLGWPAVQGNTDRYINDLEGKLESLGPDEASFARYLERIVGWTRDALGAALTGALGEMGTSVRLDSGAGAILVVHGVPGNDEVGLFRNDDDGAIARKLGESDAAVIACGHTHMAFVRHVSDALVVNCGSVGRSHDGQPGLATYAVLDDSTGLWSATIRRVPYDHQAAYREVARLGVPVSDAMANTLTTALAPV